VKSWGFVEVGSRYSVEIRIRGSIEDISGLIEMGSSLIEMSSSLIEVYRPELFGMHSPELIEVSNLGTRIVDSPDIDCTVGLEGD